MPKCGKAWSCPLKAGNTSGNAHPAKADAATAVADSAGDVSATTGSATVKSATSKSSTSTAVTSCHKPLTGRSKKDRSNQAKYRLCFHGVKVSLRRGAVATAHAWYLLLTRK